MKRKLFLLALALGVLVLALALSHTHTAAQSGGAYTLTWNSIDGGGETFSAGGAYSLGGTIGQADAGTTSGGNFSLAGGFWISDISNLVKVHLPLILK
jgi:uncharacterized membrane protein